MTDAVRTLPPSPAPPRTPTVLGGVLTDPLNWLLLAVPVALGLRWLHAGEVWVFVASGLAIVPLAGWLGRATEQLADTLGAGAGGLLNATLGNAAELIIGVMVLWRGPELYPLLKASITGSIIGNILLILGLSFLAGGLRYPKQVFNATAASMGTTLMTLATVGLIVPSLYYYLLTVGKRPDAEELHRIESLSGEIAVILAVVYGLSLLFQLRTHQHLFSGSAGPHDPTEEDVGPPWGTGRALAVMFAATAGIAVMSELLVHSVEQAATSLGFNEIFVGVIVVAIVGNAAEHSTAVIMARKNKMDLSIQIAVGSGLQIALFVAPVLVGVSHLVWPEHPLDLHFTPLELMAVVASIVILGTVSQDGESHWMEGVMMLAVYLIFGLAFYHLPPIAWGR